MKKLALTLLTILIATSLFAGGSSEETKTISTDGSTSMEKVIGSLGEAYMAQNKGVKFTYNPTGSSSGILAVLEGRCDIGLSSRALKSSEVEKGVKATILALDGIAIIVHPSNPISDLTLQEISDLYIGKTTNWKDLGGEVLPVVLIGREAGSGTRDGFEAITKTSDMCMYKQELTSTGDVITTVSQNPSAIGYASLASIKESVKALSVDGVVANEENVKNGSYQVQRPFILVTLENKELSAAATDFFNYITSSSASEIISKAGAVAVN